MVIEIQLLNVYFKGSPWDHTHGILFLKSMSERGGSDIQRILNWIMNLQNSPFPVSVVYVK